MNHSLIGTYWIQSFKIHNITTSQVYQPYGESPQGTLLITQEGYVSVAVMADRREPLSSETAQLASDSEKIKAYESYLSYSGTWHTEANQLVVKVQVSLLPNWSGKEHFRYFDLNENWLTLQTPVFQRGQHQMRAELIWKKL